MGSLGGRGAVGGSEGFGYILMTRGHKVNGGSVLMPLGCEGVRGKVLEEAPGILFWSRINMKLGFIQRVQSPAWSRL